MLDINFIRGNSEIVKEAVRKKYMKVDIDRLLELDKERRRLIQEEESLRAQQKHISEKLIKEKNKDDIEEAKSLKEKIKETKILLNAVEDEYQGLMLLVPNIPAEDTPVGPDETANRVVFEWGEIPKFDFGIKNHIQLGEKLDIIDIEAGVKVSGFRGYYLKKEGAALHFALLWYAYQKILKAGFQLLVGPTLVKEFVLTDSGYFPFGKEEAYQIGNPGKLADGKTLGEPTYLTGTSEPTLIAYFADKVLNENELPIRVCGFSPCYRSEAGSYGKDTQGLYRLHEFMKVEQVVICKADTEESNQWLETMRHISEEILQDLKMSYRVVQNSSGDMGAGKYKMYDIETWMPSRNRYSETHSDSNLTDWQARRFNIKYRSSQGKTHFAYTLNNTVLASPRILIAVLENYQQKDGSILVPEVLREYTGFEKIG